MPSTVGVVSDAERRLHRLGTGSAAVLTPLARLLLRTESIASSKVEGLQVDARDLARGGARADTGGKLNPTTAEVFVPPISVVFARDRERTIAGLTAYRNGEVDRWIETLATATVQATDLAASSLDEVAQLTERWREMLRAAPNPRADAGAWAIIDLLPAHPSP